MAFWWTRSKFKRIQVGFLYIRTTRADREQEKKKLAGDAAERLSGVMHSDFPESCSEMQQDKEGGESEGHKHHQRQ